MTTETTKCSFMDLLTGDTLTLDLNPDEVTMAQGVEGGSVPIPGTTIPRSTTGAGGVQSISFTVRLARLSSLDPETIVKDQVSWFFSLNAPLSGGEIGQNQWTPVQFVWGELYDLPVKVASVSSNFLQFRTLSALPEWADVSLTLEALAIGQIFAPDVRTGNKAFARFIL